MHPNCRSTTQLVLDEEYKQKESSSEIPNNSKEENKEPEKTKKTKKETKRPLYSTKLNKESKEFIKNIGGEYKLKDKEYKQLKEKENSLVLELKKKQREIIKADIQGYSYELRNEYNKIWSEWKEINTQAKN